MIDYPDDFVRRVQGPVTAPWFLMEITLDRPYFLTTGAPGNHHDQDWEGGMLRNISVGQDEASFEFVNAGFSHTMSALSGLYDRAPVRIFDHPGSVSAIDPSSRYVEPEYFENGYAEGYDTDHPVLKFEGHVSHVSAIGTWLSISASRSVSRRFPSLRILPPLANYVMTPGTALRSGSFVYRVEGRNG